MKTKHLLQKTFLLSVALLGGVSSAWADGTISIPHNLGNFISLGTSSGQSGDVSTGVNLSNCKVDNSNTRSISETTNYFTIGTTGRNSVATFNVTVSSAADFIFRFKSGASGCSATMDLSLKNSGNTVVWSKTGEAIDNTGSWDLNQLHIFNLGNLVADSYTLTLTITGNTGSYAGNWGDFCFHTATEVPLPTSTDPYLNMVEGSFVNTRYNNDNVINYIRPDGYIDNLVFYNSTAGYYMFNFKNSESNSGYTDAKIKLNVYDAFTGTEDGEYTIDASTSSATNKDLITGKLTAGWKKFRITFLSATAKSEEVGETKKYLFNFANAYFSAINDVLPMYGTAVLDLSKGSMTSSSNPRYSSNGGTNNEISYINDGGYADNLYVVIDGNETAYYDLRTVTSNYNKGGTFKVTITDVETGTIEVNAEESPEITSNEQSIVMPLTGSLSPGLKKIRLDFVKDGESAWLYNIKDVCFSKTAVTGTITPAGWATFASSSPLDLSTISGGTAYYASAASESTVTLTPTTETVPAGEGLMIKGTAGETFTINVAASGTSISGNLLKGQTTTGNVAASGTDSKYHYVFGYKTSDATEYGFYNLASTTSVPAGKAYLETTTELTPDLSARAITIVLADEILTGIDQIDNVEVESSLPVKRIVNSKLVIEKKGMMFNANGVRIY